MKVVIQRVSQASVLVDSNPIGNIELGYLVLLGIEAEDSMDDVVWLSKKICNLRIFADQEGNMNNNIVEVDGNIVSRFVFTCRG